MNAKKTKLGLIISTLLGTQVALALPQGAQVVNGAATFSTPNTSTLNVTNSNNAVINWQQFNIGAGQTTNFIQPSSTSSVLNRVVGNNPSQILGNLNSNGQVYLINQHGILVGEGARINTQGFFASTLNITDQDFLNGNLKFSKGGLGDIENHGYIHAGENGNIVLIAPNIENGGVIEVENGNIILAAGESITISSLDNSNVEFQVQTAANEIKNLGSVIAKNGAAGLFAGTLKHSGLVRATGLVRDENGVIRLVALTNNDVSGTLDVSGEQGGRVEVLGDKVSIQSGALVDASGQSGGGEILIGGDQQGFNERIKNATSTSIEKNAVVKADAIHEGDGGKVIVFAKSDVHVHEKISATGGALSGDGGFIETSGLEQLDIQAVPDASAKNGKAGEWLIDPNNITIQNAGVDSNVTPTPDFSSTADSAILTTSSIEAALNAGTSVTVSTTASATNTESGDITVNDDITVSASVPGNLTLNAHNNINVNAKITSSIGLFNVDLNANLAGNGGIVSFDNAAINTFGGILTLSGNGVAINNAVNFLGTSFINVSAPFTLNALSSLELGSSFGDVVFSTTGTIQNNGTLTINTACNFPVCSSVSINGAINNNGSINFISGDLNVQGTLNLNSGSTFVAPTESVTPQVVASQLLLKPGSVLNVNAPVTLDEDLILVLDNTTVNDFHNLGLPTEVNVIGGTINFNQDIFQSTLPAKATFTIAGNTPFVINGQDNTFAYSGAMKWLVDGTASEIVINSARMILFDELSILGLTFDAAINGNNGTLSFVSGADLYQNTESLISINVPVFSNGFMEITNTAGSLSLTNQATLNLVAGAGLGGVGTYVGDVSVRSGGRLSPGVRGNDTFSDNTGLLTIVGNLSFTEGSLLLMEIDDVITSLTPPTVNDYSFDALKVLGSATFDGGDVYFLWDTLATATPLINNTLDVLEATTVNFNVLNVHGLPGFSGHSLSAVTTGLQFTTGTSTADIRFWDGGASTDNWGDASNWNGDTLPLANEIVVLETSRVNLGSATNLLGVTQIDTELNINANGSLNGNDFLYTIGSVNLTDASANVSGSGLWYNFGQVDFEKAGFAYAKGTLNYGNWRFSEFSTATLNSTVSSSSFQNFGSMFVPANTNNINLDFTAASSGFDNFGQVLLLMNGFDIQFSGALNNAGVVDAVSSTNVKNTFTLEGDSTHTGAISGDNTRVAFSGGTHVLNTGTEFFNFSDLIVNSTGILNVAATTAMATNMVLTLNGGTIINPGNLQFPSTFNWNGGTLKAGTNTIASIASSMNITASLSDAIIDGIQLTTTGDVTFSGSGNDISLTNDAIWTNAGVLNLNVTDNNSDITEATGTANKLINTGTINSNPTLGIDILAKFDNRSNLNVVTGIFSVNNVSENSGAINIGTAATFLVGNATGSSLVLAGTGASLITGTGLFQIDSNAEFNVAVAPSFAQDLILSLNGGTISHASNLDFPTSFLWNGGTVSSVSNVLIDSNIQITGAVSNAIISAPSLTTTGIVNFTGAGKDVLLDNNAQWQNAGTLNINVSNLNSDIANAVGSAGTFTNASTGILNVASIAGAEIQTAFNNNGAINIQSGSLSISNLSTHSGSLDISTGTSFIIASGANSNLTLVGSPTISGLGSFIVDSNSIFNVDVAPSFSSGLKLDLLGGTISQANNLAFPTEFNWLGGTLAGNADSSVTIASTVALSTAQHNVTLDTIDLITTGLVSVQGSGNDIVLNNNAVWDTQGELRLNSAGLVSGTGSVVVGSGGSLDAFTSLSLGQNILLKLDGGTLKNAQNVLLPGTFDWIDGEVTGTEGSAFALAQGSTLNMPLGATNRSLLTVDMSVDGFFNIATVGTIANDNRLKVGGNGVANTLTLNANSVVSGGGLVFVADKANLNVANGLSLPLSIINEGNLNFLGSATLTHLGLNATNASVKVGSSGQNLAGDTLSLGSLNWQAGNLDGSASTSAKLITTLASELVNGTMADINWAVNNALDVNTQGSLSGVGSMSINTGAVLSVSSPLTVGQSIKTTLNGGSISSAENLSLVGEFNWLGGVISGASNTFFTLAQDSTLNLLGSLSNMVLHSVGLKTKGATVFSGPDNDLVLSDNAVWLNSGAVDISSISGISEVNSTTAGFTNTGTLNLSSTGFNIATSFKHQGGALTINSGEFELSAGASLSAPVTIAQNARFVLSNDTALPVEFLAGSSIAGAGTITTKATLTIADGISMAAPINVIGGTVNLEGALSLANLNFTAGTINVDTLGDASSGDSLTVANLNWTAGQFVGDGSANLFTTGITALNNGVLKDIVWSNTGTINWSGLDTQTVSLTNATLRNEATGVINISTNTSLNRAPTTLTSTLQEKGINSSGGAFINQGIINLNDSNLNLNGLTLALDTSTATLNGSGTITGNLVNTAGLIAVGSDAAVGALRVVGNYTQGADGRLTIRVFNVDSDNEAFSTFAVSGQATLAGEMKIAYAGNEEINLDSFRPFSFGSTEGAFTTIVDSLDNTYTLDLVTGKLSDTDKDEDEDEKESIKIIDKVIAEEIAEAQEELEDIIKELEEEGDEKIDFIKEAIEAAASADDDNKDDDDDEDEDDKEKKDDDGPKLVCK